MWESLKNESATPADAMSASWRPSTYPLPSSQWPRALKAVSSMCPPSKWLITGTWSGSTYMIADPIACEQWRVMAWEQASLEKTGSITLMDGSILDGGSWLAWSASQEIFDLGVISAICVLLTCRSQIEFVDEMYRSWSDTTCARCNIYIVTRKAHGSNAGVCHWKILCPPLTSNILLKPRPFPSGSLIT